MRANRPEFGGLGLSTKPKSSTWVVNQEGRPERPCLDVPFLTAPLTTYPVAKRWAMPDQTPSGTVACRQDIDVRLPPQQIEQCLPILAQLQPKGTCFGMNKLFLGQSCTDIGQIYTA